MSSEIESQPTPVTIRQMPDAAIAVGILAFLGGLALAGVLVGIGVPTGLPLGAWWNLVFVAIWLGGGGVLAALSWRATGLRFERDRLVVTRPTGWRRVIPWAHVRSLDVSTEHNEDGDVISRWLTLTVLRHPEVPVPPMPTIFGEFRAWRREHFRDVRLGVRLAHEEVDARTWYSRMSLRTRQSVLRELEARGLRVRT